MSLRRKKPLRRKTPLQRYTPLERHTPLKPVNHARRKRRRKECFGPQAKLARTLPCCVCKRRPPSDPAHVRSRGAGGKDRGNVIPLCRTCHDRQGSMGIKSFQEWAAVDFWEVAASLEGMAYGIQEFRPGEDSPGTPLPEEDK